MSPAGGEGSSPRIVERVLAEVAARRPYVRVERVSYPDPGAPLPTVFTRFGSFRNAYERALKVGKRKLARAIAVAAAGKTSCVPPRTLVIGHGLGAQIVGDVVQTRLSGRQRATVKRVALLSDPRFDGEQPGSATVGSYDRSKSGAWGAVGSIRRLAKDDLPVFRSFCVRGDPICNLSRDNLDSCLRRPARCPHDRYDTARYQGRTYVRTAARSLARQLFAAGPAPVGSTVAVEDLPTGSSVPSADLSADGAHVVYAFGAGNGPSVVRYWSPGTGLAVDIDTAAAPRTSVAISADGRFVSYVVAAASGGSAVRVWDRATASVADQIEVASPPHRVGNLDLAANGRVLTLLVGNSDVTVGLGEVHLWDRDAGPPTRLTDGTGTASLPSVSADGRHVAYEKGSGAVCVWDLGVGTSCRDTVVRYAYPKLSGDGRFLAVQNAIIDRLTGATSYADDCAVRDCRARPDLVGSSLSADGRFYAYRATRGSIAEAGLFLLDAGRAVNDLVAPPSTDATEPHVSDDGRRVLYVARAYDTANTVPAWSVRLWSRSP